MWVIAKILPNLEKIATLGQGISYESESALPNRPWTIHDPPHADDVLGYYSISEDLVIYNPPSPVGMNLDRRAIARKRSGMPTGSPCVVFTYSRVSRGPWRIK